MARYNTSQTATTTSGATTINAPAQGYIQSLTGTAPFTVAIPDPRLYPGIEQVYYNATTGTGVVTLTSPSGIFVGGGASGTASQTFNTGSTITLVSDGTNYIIVNEDGGALIATTGTFSGTLTAQSIVSLSPANANVTISPTGSGTVTINPGSAGNIDNTVIGNTTRAIGNFTTVNANNGISISSGSLSLTSGNITLTAGGLTASAGTVSASTISGTSITGTISTAAQTNITSVGTLSNLQATSMGVGQTADGTTGNFRCTGTIIAGGNIQSTSDASLKTNIVTISDALSKALALRGVMYDRISNGAHEMGVIAQEVEAIIPELVFTNAEGIKSVAYANTVALLIEAIKEQQQQIDELKAKVH